MTNEDELRARLREAAEAHRPDRARMLARVERGMAADARAVPARPVRPVPWLRVAGAAVAVAGIFAAGGYAVTALSGPSRSSAATGSEPSAEPRLRAEGVIDPGSNRYWAQSDLTVTTSTPLSGLVVELRVAQTGGVASTGNWRTRPAEDFTVSVREDGGALVYRWTLTAGRTVPAGRHVFAGQYNHAEGGRDAGSDTYTVTATDTSGHRASARGGFAPTAP
ncbi:hypothetical protein [Streptomyces sp. NBC_01353]|uniref:hypothetical protein n=1 Tax=Streptomyces sp. NBC_01353 TaxID=2903835 RepID=UPI002E308CBB|nr:hypothetical protein [Streptomyces sp. NBC_01353]